MPPVSFAAILSLCTILAELLSSQTLIPNDLLKAHNRGLKAHSRGTTTLPQPKEYTFPKDKTCHNYWIYIASGTD
jgi:hypothetical protein